MSSDANTSLRKAMEELDQALKSSFGDKHHSKEAIAQLEATIKSIETRLDITSEILAERLSKISDEDFSPEATQNVEVVEAQASNAVAASVRS